MSIEIRLIEASEIRLANNFFNAVYKTARSIENFKWEFLEGPFGKAIYVVAMDTSASEPKVVGIQCAIPVEMINAEGKVVLTGKSEDTLVDPGYRGKKIFEKMYDLLFAECKKAGIQYIWGFTPAQKAFERIGFDIPFRSEQALLVFKPAAAYRYLKSLNPKNTALDRMKILALVWYSWAKGLAGRTPSHEPLKAKLSPVDNADVFARFYPDTSYYTIHETSAYVEWRMRRNPFGNQYKVFRYPKADPYSFHAILNTRPEVCYLEQFYYRDPSAAKHAMRQLLAALKKADTPLIRVLCFSHNEEMQKQQSLLSASGFFLLKRGSYFVWKDLSDEKPLAPRQLFITRLFTQGNQ